MDQRSYIRFQKLRKMTTVTRGTVDIFLCVSSWMPPRTILLNRSGGWVANECACGEAKMVRTFLSASFLLLLPCFGFVYYRFYTSTITRDSMILIEPEVLKTTWRKQHKYSSSRIRTNAALSLASFVHNSATEPVSEWDSTGNYDPEPRRGVTVPRITVVFRSFWKWLSDLWPMY